MFKDSEIELQLKGPQPIADGINFDLLGTSLSPVKGASLDLTIGQILVPGEPKDKPGGVEQPLSELCLLQGHTAVIRTAEQLHLPKDVAAIAFPPSTVSLSGLLTTNPGHVDPGYVGPLHLTVINMGRLPFSLKRGDRIIRLIFFKLSGLANRPVVPPPPMIDQALLDRLSRDFLDVDERAAKAAEKEVQKANLAKDIRATRNVLYASMVTGVAALVGTAVTLYAASNSRDDQLRKELSEIKAQIAGLDVRTNLQDRLSTLAGRLSRIEAAIKPVSPAAGSNPP